jgi:phytanoyl-CoA hydroxylase
MAIYGGLSRRYARDGFAVVPGVFSNTECRAVIDALNRMDLSKRDPLDVVRVAGLSSRQRAGVSRTAAGDAVYIVGCEPHRNATLARLISDTRIERLTRAALGAGPVAYHFSNMTDKPPRVGPLVGWHRDFFNGLARLNRGRFLRVMVCLDGMTRSNGAIGFEAGSHLVSSTSLRRNRFRKSGRKNRQARLALCPPGSAVVFDSKVRHGSGPNRSSTPRRTVIIQFGMGYDRLIATSREAWTGAAPQTIRRGLASAG